MSDTVIGSIIVAFAIILASGVIRDAIRALQIDHGPITDELAKLTRSNANLEYWANEAIETAHRIAGTERPVLLNPFEGLFTAVKPNTPSQPRDDAAT